MDFWVGAAYFTGFTASLNIKTDGCDMLRLIVDCKRTKIRQLILVRLDCQCQVRERNLFILFPSCCIFLHLSYCPTPTKKRRNGGRPSDRQRRKHRNKMQLSVGPKRLLFLLFEKEMHRNVQTYPDMSRHPSSEPNKSEKR